MSAVNCEVRKLQGVITLQKGKPPAQQPYFGTDADLYLTPEYLRGKASAESVKPSANAVRIVDGETIVLWDGSNAGEFFRGRKGILASTMSCIKHGETFDGEYFYYAMKNSESYLKSQTSGSGIPHVDKEVLGNLEILLFTKSEQSKIAEILSTVDRAIEQTETLIAKQQRIKTGLMQDLLTRGIDEHGNLRSEQTHKFKDSPLGRIPVEWEVHPISKFGSKNRSWLRTGPFGSDLNTKHWETHGVPVLTIGSLGEGEVIESELLYVSDSTSEALKGFHVNHEDIVFSRVADIGRSLVVRKHQKGWIISSNLMRISLDVMLANPELLYRNISYNSAIRTQLRTNSNSGGRELVNGPILSGLLFPWPDFSEQETIILRLKSMDEEILMLREQLNKFSIIKTALMQDLLTGKKRVTALLKDTEVATQ